MPYFENLRVKKLVQEDAISALADALKQDNKIVGDILKQGKLLDGDYKKLIENLNAATYCKEVLGKITSKEDQNNVFMDCREYFNHLESVKSYTKSIMDASLDMLRNELSFLRGEEKTESAFPGTQLDLDARHTFLIQIYKRINELEENEFNQKLNKFINDIRGGSEEELEKIIQITDNKNIPKIENLDIDLDKFEARKKIKNAAVQAVEDKKSTEEMWKLLHLVTAGKQEVWKKLYEDKGVWNKAGARLGLGDKPKHIQDMINCFTPAGDHLDEIIKVANLADHSVTGPGRRLNKISKQIIDAPRIAEAFAILAQADVSEKSDLLYVLIYNVLGQENAIERRGEHGRSVRLVALIEGVTQIKFTLKNGSVLSLLDEQEMIYWKNISKGIMDRLKFDELSHEQQAELSPYVQKTWVAHDAKNSLLRYIDSPEVSEKELQDLRGRVEDKINQEEKNNVEDKNLSKGIINSIKNLAEGDAQEVLDRIDEKLAVIKMQVAEDTEARKILESVKADGGRMLTEIGELEARIKAAGQAGVAEFKQEVPPGVAVAKRMLDKIISDTQAELDRQPARRAEAQRLKGELGKVNPGELAAEVEAFAKGAKQVAEDTEARKILESVKADGSRMLTEIGELEARIKAAGQAGVAEFKQEVPPGVAVAKRRLDKIISDTQAELDRQPARLAEAQRLKGEVSKVNLGQLAAEDSNSMRLQLQQLKMEVLNKSQKLLHVDRGAAAAGQSKLETELQALLIEVDKIHDDAFKVDLKKILAEDMHLEMQLMEARNKRLDELEKLLDTKTSEVQEERKLQFKSEEIKLIEELYFKKYDTDLVEFQNQFHPVGGPLKDSPIADKVMAICGDRSIGYDEKFFQIKGALAGCLIDDAKYNFKEYSNQPPAMASRAEIHALSEKASKSNSETHRNIFEIYKTNFLELHEDPTGEHLPREVLEERKNSLKGAMESILQKSHVEDDAERRELLELYLRFERLMKQVNENLARKELTKQDNRQKWFSVSEPSNVTTQAEFDKWLNGIRNVIGIPLVNKSAAELSARTAENFSTSRVMGFESGWLLYPPFSNLTTAESITKVVSSQMVYAERIQDGQPYEMNVYSLSKKTAHDFPSVLNAYTSAQSSDGKTVDPNIKEMLSRMSAADEVLSAMLARGLKEPVKIDWIKDPHLAMAVHVLIQTHDIKNIIIEKSVYDYHLGSEDQDKKFKPAVDINKVCESFVEWQKALKTEDQKLLLRQQQETRYLKEVNAGHNCQAAPLPFEEHDALYQRFGSEKKAIEFVNSIDNYNFSLDDKGALEAIVEAKDNDALIKALSDLAEKMKPDFLIKENHIQSLTRNENFVERIKQAAQDKIDFISMRNLPSYW